jgi:hypothetical protein
MARAPVTRGRADEMLQAGSIRRCAAWSLLAVFGGLAASIYWPGDDDVAAILRAGGTVQILTSTENRGRIAITFPDSVTDADLERMNALDRLRPAWLQLRGRQISGFALASLRRLVGLRGLTLHGTSITDDDLVALQSFPELATLNLDGSRISARGLDHLKELHALRCVSLRFTTLSDEAIRQFQAARPDVRVLSHLTDQADE